MFLSNLLKTAEQTEALQKIEMLHSFEDIILFREIAMDKVSKEMCQREKKTQNKVKSFFALGRKKATSFLKSSIVSPKVAPLSSICFFSNRN